MSGKREGNRKWMRTMALPAAMLGGTLLVGGGILAVRELWLWTLTVLGQWIVHFCQLTVWAAQ